MSAQKRAAAHEAGHVVADIVLGIPVAGVEIGAEGGGHVDLAEGWYRCSRTDLAVAALAGAVAEAMLCGEPLAGTADADLANVAAVINDGHRRAVPPALRDDLVERLRRCARRLVRQHQVEIELVAGALLARGRLTAADLALLADGPVLGQPWPLVRFGR